jgi:uncharacterized protein (DUF1501 family)
MNRRHFVGAAGAAGLLSGLTFLSPLTRQVQASDYRALIVIDLAGGNDGHNMLIPVDGAYSDYEKARTSVLALPKDSLIRLNGTSVGHNFALHPAMPKIASLYNQERLAFLSNVGALIEPATAAQVKANAVRLPIGLLSHNDQAGFVQGASEDTSGWAGRGLETLPSSLKHRVGAVALSNNRTLVQGRRSSVSIVTNGGNAWWGRSNLMQDDDVITQSVKRMARWQFANDYERIYANSLNDSVSDSVMFAQARQMTAAPTQDFGSGWFPGQLQFVARVLPVMPSFGMRRQVFFLTHGGFDTHTSQRGSGEQSQDTLLSVLDKALGALDATLRSTGMADKVMVMVMTEFGRTLRPGSGGGSEHAWGTHWMVMGPQVEGARVHGRFPPLLPGGSDDGDTEGNGRFVPTISADQVGATLMGWLGLESGQTLSVFPNLKNFANHTVPFLRA